MHTLVYLEHVVFSYFSAIDLFIRRRNSCSLRSKL